MSRAVPEQGREGERFRHEAFFYSGREDFFATTLPFIREGVRLGESVLVAVSADKIAELHSRLGDEAGHMSFVDMVELGTNPARIIPAWRDFLDGCIASGTGARGIGEPVWAERSPDELREAELHEELLNVAFDGPVAWPLMCPYDAPSLSQAVIDQARRSHPFVVEDGVSATSAAFEPASASDPFDAPLRDPGIPADELTFEEAQIDPVRRLVHDDAVRWGLDPSRAADLALAAHEVAANSVRHGGGRGVLRLWREPGRIVCEVGDDGRIEDPLIGRRRPGPAEGFGSWIVNQVCDLVQIRSGPEGTIVRLHISLGTP